MFTTISPQIMSLPVLVQSQPIVSRIITKNYVDKLKLVIQFGNTCRKCRSWELVDNLTLDHISPKFLCQNTHYNSDSNKQLLCKICHKQKSKRENSFLSRMTRRMIEEIHNKNNTIIDVTDIVQEYSDLIEREKWLLNFSRKD
jgi:5-methylcytosine-specific restriction endonuclease McrA